MKNHVDTLIFHTAICAEASQICFLCTHRNRLREFRWRSLRKKRFEIGG